MNLGRDFMSPEALKYQEVKCKSVLGTFGMLNTQFWTSYCFDPYNNCEFNCLYCHTASQKFEGRRDFSVPVYAKTNAPQVLARELSMFKRKGIVRLSLSTDPYQPAEKKYRITRQILELLNEKGWPFAIGTKSDLVLRDIDLLEEAAKKSWCCVAVTITTLNENLAKTLEPNAPSPQRRLEVIKTLSDRGITVGLWIIPLIPYVTDSEENMSEVIEAAAKNGAKFVLTGMLDMRGTDRFKNFLSCHEAPLLAKYSELYEGRPLAPSCGNMDESYLYATYVQFDSLCRRHGIQNYIPHFYSRKQALLFYIHNYSKFSGKPFHELNKTVNFLFPAKEILQVVHVKFGKHPSTQALLKILGFYPK
jgi:DNA repair photolyase